MRLSWGDCSWQDIKIQLLTSKLSDERDTVSSQLNFHCVLFKTKGCCCHGEVCMPCMQGTAVWSSRHNFHCMSRLNQTIVVAMGNLHVCKEQPFAPINRVFHCLTWLNQTTVAIGKFAWMPGTTVCSSQHSFSLFDWLNQTIEHCCHGQVCMNARNSCLVVCTVDCLD